MFSELLLKEGAKDVKRTEDGNDGDNLILFFCLMSIQGTWKHKGSLEDNYKMTEMNLY